MVKNDPREYKYDDPDTRLKRESYTKNRIKRFIMNKLLKFVAGPTFVLTNPEFMGMLYNKEFFVGLLEKSIIQNPLYIPSDNGSLEKLEAKGWNFSGYDFDRISEFGKDVVSKKEGRIVSFLLDRIKNNHKDVYTLTGILNIFDPIDVLTFEKPSVDYLIENGMLEKTTYQEAYSKTGLYGGYAKSMNILDISENEVYQVTPKGNGLMFLWPDGGDSSQKKKKIKELRPAFEFK